MTRQKKIARPSVRRSAKQQGIAMIEVLVSMLIIAMWLLASAGMQAGMFKLQKSADYRLKAIALATELGERMEANSGVAKTGSYALAAGATVTAPSDCAQVACSPANLASYDLAQWSGRVSSALIVDTVTVTQDTTAAQPTYNISISWKEPRGKQTYSATGSTETATYTTVKVLG
jgi:type IV pilus assembly protein PilV